MRTSVLARANPPCAPDTVKIIIFPLGVTAVVQGTAGRSTPGFQPNGCGAASSILTVGASRFEDIAIVNYAVQNSEKEFYDLPVHFPYPYLSGRYGINKLIKTDWLLLFLPSFLIRKKPPSSAQSYFFPRWSYYSNQAHCHDNCARIEKNCVSKIINRYSKC